MSEEKIKITRRNLLKLGAVAGFAAAGLTGKKIKAQGRKSMKNKGRIITLDAKPGPISIDTAQTAVIVVDMQNDFGSEGGMFQRAGLDISGIKKAVMPTANALTAARKAGIPVIYLKMAFKPDLSDAGSTDSVNYVRHINFLQVGKKIKAPNGNDSRILIRDTWNTDIVDELAPEKVDTVIYKTRFSGFYKTELDDILKERGIKYLIFTGCTTNICVDSTIRDAMFRDYLSVLLTDCTAEPLGNNFARTNHEASLFAIQALLGWTSDSSIFVKGLEIQS